MKELKNEFEATDGVEFPGEVYVEELLKPIFNDQKEYLFEAMFKINKAHTTMLTEQGILTNEEYNKIFEGLNLVEGLDRSELLYTEEFEDLFFLVESKIGDHIGDELAGKMHIAKSRNDMGEAMYR